MVGSFCEIKSKRNFLQLTVSLKKTKQDTESLFELRTVRGVGFCPNAVVNGSVCMNLVLEYMVGMALVSWLLCVLG